MKRSTDPPLGDELRLHEVPRHPAFRKVINNLDDCYITVMGTC